MERVFLVESLSFFSTTLIIYGILKLLVLEEIANISIGIFHTFFIGYIIYEATRKNAIYYRNKDNYTLKIDGEKLELDLQFLSGSFIDEKELNIKRINRIDTFSIAHLRQSDIDKLLGVLKEYELKEV